MQDLDSAQLEIAQTHYLRLSNNKLSGAVPDFLFSSRVPTNLRGNVHLKVR